MHTHQVPEREIEERRSEIVKRKREGQKNTPGRLIRLMVAIEEFKSICVFNFNPKRQGWLQEHSSINNKRRKTVFFYVLYVLILHSLPHKQLEHAAGSLGLKTSGTLCSMTFSS